MKKFKRYPQFHIHCSVFTKQPKQSTSPLMDEENMVLAYNEILLSLKKGGNSVLGENKDEPGGKYEK